MIYLFLFTLFFNIEFVSAQALTIKNGSVISVGGMSFLVEGLVNTSPESSTVSLMPFDPQKGMLVDSTETSNRVIATFSKKYFLFETYTGENVGTRGLRPIKLNAEYTTKPNTFKTSLLPNDGEFKFHNVGTGSSIANVKGVLRRDDGILITPEKVLGMGGMGTVYESILYDPKLPGPPKKIALKISRPMTSKSKEGISEYAFEQMFEAHKNAVKLRSPNIVRTFFTTIRTLDDGTQAIYTAMEVVEGKTLKEFLDNRFSSLTFQEALRSDNTEIKDQAWELLKSLSSQMENVLLELRDQKLVHGDIKPSNFIVQENANGSVTLKLIDTDTMTRVKYPNTMFTKKYLSPEAWRELLDQKYLTSSFALDQFAIQRILYMMSLGNSFVPNGLELLNPNDLSEKTVSQLALEYKKLAINAREHVHDLREIAPNWMKYNTPFWDGFEDHRIANISRPLKVEVDIETIEKDLPEIDVLNSSETSTTARTVCPNPVIPRVMRAIKVLDHPN